MEVKEEVCDIIFGTLQSISSVMWSVGEHGSLNMAGETAFPWTPAIIFTNKLGGTPTA